jgi:hypothetical protein
MGYLRVGLVGRIAQVVEQLTLNQRVQGSSPCAPTNLQSTAVKLCAVAALRSIIRERGVAIASSRLG